MSKPDWKDAPEWAEWLAQDKTGSWYWHEYKPYHHRMDFWSSPGRTSWFPHLYDDENPNWTSTLERRPC